MGSVTMESKFLGNSPIDNYPDNEITDYIYCDKCGSFQVKGYLTSDSRKKTGIGIILLILSGIVAVMIMTMSFLNSELSMLLSCPVWLFAGFVLLIIGMLSAEDGHYCLKCGNRNIDQRSNTLAYPLCDKSVLDVPTSTAHKHRR